MPNIFSFVMIATGAFICWALKGFTGRFEDEMVGPYDRSAKRTRSLLIGAAVLLSALALLGNL